MRSLRVAAATVASALVLAACGAEAPEVDSVGDPTESTTEEAPEEEAEPSPSVANAADEEPDDADAVEEEEEEAEEPDSDGLGLGASADVGDYTVTVTDVLLDANEAVKEANAFNEDPESQYVLVTVEVTYTGSEEGDPWLDLSIELAGSDARIYDSSSCSAVSPHPVFDVPTLTSGGTATFDECFDVPSEALSDPRISVEESLSFADTKAIWRTDERAAEDAEEAAQPETPAAPPADDALALGSTADVGEYSVTVTDVQLNANDVVQQANMFNDAPQGQYVLVSLDVTYTGDEEGDPWLDLSVELAGSDARIYDSTTCMAVTPHDVMDLPTLANGGQGTFDICFDVPPAALDNPVLYVEESLSFDDARVAWRTTS